MKEKGIDISGHSSDQLTDEMIEWADMVISVADYTADEICPESFKGRKLDWKIGRAHV